MTLSPSSAATVDEPMNISERIRCDIAMQDEGYKSSLDRSDIEELLEAYDRLAIPAVAQQQSDCGYLPDEEASGKTAVRLLDLWSEIDGAENLAPYQETMAFLVKPNSAGWVWAHEVRFERDFDKEQARQRDVAIQCVMDAEATAAVAQQAVGCDDILSVLYTYRDHEPEEDESWESWYYAAFDLACVKIRELFGRPGIEYPKPDPAQAGKVPAGWFIGDAEDGFHQVAKQFEGDPGTTALYASPSPSSWQPIDRNAVIEECAKVCEDLRHEDYSCETSEWSGGTFDCARAVRALAVSSTHCGSPK